MHIFGFPGTCGVFWRPVWFHAKALAARPFPAASSPCRMVVGHVKARQLYIIDTVGRLVWRIQAAYILKHSAWILLNSLHSVA